MRKNNKDEEELRKELAEFNEDPPAPEPAVQTPPVKQPVTDFSNIPAGSITDLYAKTDVNSPRVEVVTWPFWDEKKQEMVDRKYEVKYVDISWEKLNLIIDEAYNTTQSVLGRKRKVQIERMKTQIKTIAGAPPVWQMMDPEFCEQLRVVLFGQLEDDKGSLVEGELLKNLLMMLMKEPEFIGTIRQELGSGPGRGRMVPSHRSSGRQRRK